jgi:uncharacterized OB-fold protein
VGRVAIEDGFFTIPEDLDEAPRLLGSRCQSCGEVFYPRRHVCARCLHEGTDDLALGPRGELHTWTYVHVPLFAKRNAKVSAYGVGQIDLPEGPRVQSVLVGGPDDFHIGMSMELELEVLGETPEGDDIVIYRFKAVS